jgi:hypothetical protein
MPSPSSNSTNQEPIGINVTSLIDQGMVAMANPTVPLIEIFASSALQVGISQQQTLGRGMILGMESPNSKKFLYIKQAESAISLWMAGVEFKREVAKLLEQYEITKEAVIAMVVPPTAQLFLASEHGEMQMLAVQEVEQTSFKLPPDVTFRKEQSGLTIAFVFTHKKLGPLGRIVVKPEGANQTRIDYEMMEPKGFSNPQERMEIFLPIAKELMERIELGLMR